jgi:hypothetical protein
LGSLALNADVALDGNRRHRHHRRRHPSEVKVAMTNRDAPKGWDAKKIPACLPQKSMCAIQCSCDLSIEFHSNLFEIIDGAEATLGSDGDRDTNKLASLSPGPISFPNKVRVSQVACGLHHSG